MKPPRLISLSNAESNYCLLMFEHMGSIYFCMCDCDILQDFREINCGKFKAYRIPEQITKFFLPGLARSPGFRKERHAVMSFLIYKAREQLYVYPFTKCAILQWVCVVGIKEKLT